MTVAELELLVTGLQNVAFAVVHGLTVSNLRVAAAPQPPVPSPAASPISSDARAA